MSNVIVKKSTIAGKGIFATAKLKQGQTIFTFEGPTIEYARPIDGRLGPNWINIGPNRWLIPNPHSPGLFTNHSCQPNAILTTGARLRALRPIRQGEEVTMDYSFTDSHPIWRMFCNCSTPHCRHIIRSIQFLPEAQFKKYRHYVPLFLQTEYLMQKIIFTEIQGTPTLVAKRTIKKDESIFTLQGPIVSYTQAPNYRLGFHWFGIGKNKWLIPDNHNAGKILKHSCNPNVGLKDQTTVVAMTTIKAGEEITIDDSMTEADPHWKVKCKCGVKSCRGTIRSVQYLSPELYKKYRPYIPAYFRAVYAKNKSEARISKSETSTK